MRDVKSLTRLVVDDGVRRFRLPDVVSEKRKIYYVTFSMKTIMKMYLKLLEVPQ